MPQASHASPPALRQDVATLRQLKELVAQMDAGKISKAEMQAFLRHRKKKDDSSANQPPALATPPDELRNRVESMAQQHYPHCASEVMELFDAFCSPTMDLEFKSYTCEQDLREFADREYDRASPKSLRSKVSRILFVKPVPAHDAELEEVFNANNNFTADKQFGVGFLGGFTETFRLFEQLDPSFNAGSKPIAECFAARYQSRLVATHAWRYGLVSNDIVKILRDAFLNLVILALGFISRGDPRAEQIRSYLKIQVSGTPLIAVHWSNPIFLAAPYR